MWDNKGDGEVKVWQYQQHMYIRIFSPSEYQKTKLSLLMKMKCGLSDFVIRICTLLEYQSLYKIKKAISVKYQMNLAVITLKYMYKQRFT